MPGYDRRRRLMSGKQSFAVKMLGDVSYYPSEKAMELGVFGLGQVSVANTLSLGLHLSLVFLVMESGIT